MIPYMYTGSHLRQHGVFMMKRATTTRKNILPTIHFHESLYLC